MLEVDATNRQTDCVNEENFPRDMYIIGKHLVATYCRET